MAALDLQSQVGRTMGSVVEGSQSVIIPSFFPCSWDVNLFNLFVLFILICQMISTWIFLIGHFCFYLYGLLYYVSRYVSCLLVSTYDYVSIYDSLLSSYDCSLLAVCLCRGRYGFYYKQTCFTYVPMIFCCFFQVQYCKSKVYTMKNNIF